MGQLGSGVWCGDGRANCEIRFVVPLGQELVGPAVRRVCGWCIGWAMGREVEGHEGVRQ